MATCIMVPVDTGAAKNAKNKTPANTDMDAGPQKGFINIYKDLRKDEETIGDMGSTCFESFGI